MCSVGKAIRINVCPTIVFDSSHLKPGQLLLLLLLLRLLILLLLAFTTHLRVLASSFLRFRDHTQ
jgi:hypothetical protein